MLKHFKCVIKKALARIGFYHPSLGIKISSEAKAEVLRSYTSPQLRVFVETGTYHGDMIERLRELFDEVYSIEYDSELYEKAVARFSEDDHVHPLKGDSGEQISKVLSELSVPALFWLDAHGPGKLSLNSPIHCPVERELSAIFSHPIKGHKILIDDARMFDVKSIKKIREMAIENNYRCIIEQGLFILTPKNSIQS